MTKAEAKRAAAIYRMQRPPDTGTPTEQWLEQLGAKFVEVLFRGRDGEIFTERHVADLETLSETVRMSLDRLNLRAAVLPYHGRWCLYTPKGGRRGTQVTEFRYYDTREAAEMVLIHNG